MCSIINLQQSMENCTYNFYFLAGHVMDLHVEDGLFKINNFNLYSNCLGLCFTQNTIDDENTSILFSQVII